MTRDIIARVIARSSNPNTIHDMAVGLSPVPRIAPTVSPGQLAAAETSLGFALPSLLRQIYLQVGNGGFGPGYGLIGLEELLQVYNEMRQLPGWPERMVPLCTWGCGIYSCLDCSLSAGPIYVYSPDTHVLEGHGISEVTLTNAEGEVVWTYHPHPSEGGRDDTLNGMDLLLHKTSLQEWIEAWVDGKNLWEEMEIAMLS